MHDGLDWFVRRGNIASALVVAALIENLETVCVLHAAGQEPRLCAGGPGAEDAPTPWTIQDLGEAVPAAAAAESSPGLSKYLP